MGQQGDTCETVESAAPVEAHAGARFITEKRYQSTVLTREGG
jgi:hypothetical protein